MRQIQKLKRVHLHSILFLKGCPHLLCFLCSSRFFKRKRTKSNFLFLSLQIFPQACVVHTQCIRNAIVLLQVRYANLSRWNPGFSFFLDRARASSKCCAFLKWDTKCLGCAVYSSNAGLPNSNLSWATLHLTFSHDKWLNILEINTICRVATTI